MKIARDSLQSCYAPFAVRSQQSSHLQAVLLQEWWRLMQPSTIRWPEQLLLSTLFCQLSTLGLKTRAPAAAHELLMVCRSLLYDRLSFR